MFFNTRIANRIYSYMYIYIYIVATIKFNTYYSHTNLNIDKDGIKIINKLFPK